MSEIKGIDTSVSSTPASMTDQLKEQNPNHIPKTAQGGAIVDEFLTGHDEVNVPDGPALHPLAEPSAFPTVVQIVNGVVTPSLQVLLFNVLGIIDASVPNKDQNRAIKKLVRDGFDKAYMEVIREAYPDSNFAMGPGHALEPYENKYKAITGIVKPE